jgi:hypothetical protein
MKYLLGLLVFLVVGVIAVFSIYFWVGAVTAYLILDKLDRI